MFLLLAVALFPFLVTLYYNWYPAKVLVSDVGDLIHGNSAGSECYCG